ncbi:MAG: hypothetical protein V4466_10380, partial [Pseudomonadota bacterium]
MLLAAGAAAQTPPPALTAQCAAAGTAVGAVPKKGVMSGLSGGLRAGGSTMFDRFSISGRSGAFLCSKEAAARRAIDRVAAPAPVNEINRRRPRRLKPRRNTRSELFRHVGPEGLAARLAEERERVL